MKRAFLLVAFLLLPVIAHASTDKPQWVSTYFSGERTHSGDYEGIAFMEIKGNHPTMQELATVESHAKQVLASRYKAIVQSRTVEHLSDYNGKTSQEASYEGLAESSLKITIAMPVFWHDEDENMIWAKVSVPRNKVDAWIEDAPLLSLSKKMTQVHGLIYRFMRNEVWIKLEDGRALRFKPDDYANEPIVVGDRVIVAYDGNRAKEVYCDGVKLQGRIFINAGM